MDAVVMNDGRLSVDVLTEPEPGPGQVTAAVLACGICGSDLHTLDHTDEFAAMSATAATITEFPTEVFDPSAGVVMGHEFVPVSSRSATTSATANLTTWWCRYRS